MGYLIFLNQNLNRTLHKIQFLRILHRLDMVRNFSFGIEVFARVCKKKTFSCIDRTLNTMFYYKSARCDFYWKQPWRRHRMGSFLACPNNLILNRPVPCDNLSFRMRNYYLSYYKYSAYQSSAHTIDPWRRAEYPQEYNKVQLENMYFFVLKEMIFIFCAKICV